MLFLFFISILSGPTYAGNLPSFQEVKSRDLPSEVVLLDRNGERLDSYRLNPKFRKAPWVALTEISPLARETLVQIEDQHFFEHEGVDWFAVGTSLIKTLKGDKARGASTLTMQLISLIDPSRAKKGKRNFNQKWDQIKTALELEKIWTKDQILEAYLNLVPLRGEIIGIRAASLFLLKKEVSALDPADAALIVAMLPAPNDSYEKLEARSCLFLKHRYEKEGEKASAFCSNVKEKIAGLKAPSPVDPDPSRPMEHFTHWRISKVAADLKGGYLKTTLDLGLQKKVHEKARESLQGIREQNVSEMAALVLENETGEVLAYLGNLQEFSKTPRVDGVQGKRQAGSTLKPFFYGLALQNRLFDLKSTLLDEPIQIQTSNGAFRPENYDHEFHGEVLFTQALASSMNIPAIKVVQAVGVDESTELVKKLGIKDVQPGYIYGPSIALGTVDVTLEELTRAYQHLAKQALGREADSGFPIKADAARKITRILSDRGARAETFGANSVLETPYFTAVKTGTSKDMRDNWCIGFSDRYTVGVWAGNFNGTPMKDVSGVTGAAPLWRKIMDELNRRESSRVPSVIAKIELPESVPAHDESAKSVSQNKIVYPQDGALLAFDPEIPADRQKVLFKPAEKETKEFWFLNDEKLAATDLPYLWEVKRGKYKLEIRTNNNVALDQVHFTVR